MLVGKRRTQKPPDVAASTLTEATRGQRGPVFYPARRLSEHASEVLRATISEPGQAVTAYDDIWFVGRPVD